MGQEVRERKEEVAAGGGGGGGRNIARICMGCSALIITKLI